MARGAREVALPHAREIEPASLLEMRLGGGRHAHLDRVAVREAPQVGSDCAHGARIVVVEQRLVVRLQALVHRHLEREDAPRRRVPLRISDCDAQPAVREARGERAPVLEPALPDRRAALDRFLPGAGVGVFLRTHLGIEGGRAQRIVGARECGKLGVQARLDGRFHRGGARGERRRREGAGEDSDQRAEGARGAHGGTRPGDRSRQRRGCGGGRRAASRCPD